MFTSVCRLSGLAFFLIGSANLVPAQEKLLPPPDRVPHLVLTHAGPHAPVTALAFAPDASALYVGGFDKQVRRYKLDKGKYVADAPLRVPIGPGSAGVVNALAVSPDGRWVAVGGRAPADGEVWDGAEDGTYVDFRRAPLRLRRDAGVVYLFDPARPNAGKVIRGMEAGVRAMAFANPAPATGPVLLTAGVEWNEKGEFFGVVRVFDVNTGHEVASRNDLPPNQIPPGLAAWATGADRKGLRVAVNWENGNHENGQLLVWDNPGPAGAGTTTRELDAAYNSVLLARAEKDGIEGIVTGGYDVKRKSGGLTVRAPNGATKSFEPISGKPGEATLPVAVAGLLVGAKGQEKSAVATVVQLRTTAERRHELRLMPAGKAEPIALVGAGLAPMLSASLDGRFVAVAGFSDNRVEVYDAAAIVAGKPTDTLVGGTRGFSKVSFLEGEKFWLGGPTDTPERGGVVLDLDRNVRVAAPSKDFKFDNADANPAPKWDDKLPARVVVTIDGAEKTVALPEGDRVTAAALLPGKPVWDATLGPVLAVAHVDRGKTARVTLYDATTAKPVYKLGGPTLPVTALTFSKARALLAGAGDDGTVTVWSMKNVGKKISGIEGLLITPVGGEVVVESVRAGAPVAAKLAKGDVLESVAVGKGVPKAVKTTADFRDAVRAMNVGDEALIKVKGKAAPVAVVVGTHTGFRHPLFTLWVDPDPAPKDGKRDWVGWTTSGPYDANSEAAEARIGWLTATGDPARPTTFAGAVQYRKLFYKRDFLRLLLTTADYNAALAQLPVPRPARAVAEFDAPRLRDGRRVTRTPIAGLNVTLDDPDGALDRDRVALQWRVVGPAGASEWRVEPFGAGLRDLDLSKHDWRRGEHKVQIRVLPKADAQPVDEITADVWYVPPPPVLVVGVDGNPRAPGAVVVTENEEVEFSATAAVPNNPDGADVLLTGLPGGPVRLVRKPDGTFAPSRVPVRPGVSGILVTATNRGPDVSPDLESAAVALRIERRLARVAVAPKAVEPPPKTVDPPKVAFAPPPREFVPVPVAVDPPRVRLLLRTEHDPRINAALPHVVSVPTVTVSATVAGPNPVGAFEWKIGDANWVGGALDANGAETRSVALPLTGDTLTLQVRAKSKDSVYATDALAVRFDGRPDASVAVPPALVTAPELKVSGAVKVVGNREFALRVLVISPRTGQAREFAPTVDPARARWDAEVTLFPGENQIGYVVRYDDDRKQARSANFVNVRYARPPRVLGAAPVDVGTAAVGAATVAAVSARDAVPTELWVNGARAALQTHTRPVVLFG
ncbi:MAG: WD40 repeat domain-containing protein, partial [Gemmata sp.]